MSELLSSAQAVETGPSETSAPLVLLNREQAILEFNRRVLAQAQREDVPLLERLRYVTIVSSNLDEFFEVRFADVLEAARAAPSEASRADLAAVAKQAHALIVEQYAVFNSEVMPALERQGIRVINHADRNAAQKQWVAAFFAAADAGRAGPGPPLPAGGQQVAELHRAAGRP